MLDVLLPLLVCVVVCSVVGYRVVRWRERLQAFPTKATVTFQTGDLFLYPAHNVVSHLMAWALNSPFYHVAMVIIIEGRPHVWEITARDHTPLLTPVDQYPRPNRLYYRAIKTPLPQDATLEFLRQHHRFQYDTNVWYNTVLTGVFAPPLFPPVPFRPTRDTTDTVHCASMLGRLLNLQDVSSPHDFSSLCAKPLWLWHPEERLV